MKRSRVAATKRKKPGSKLRVRRSATVATRKKKPATDVALLPLSEAEHALIAEHAMRVCEQGARRPPRFTVEPETADGVLETRADPTKSLELFWAQLGAVTGSTQTEAQLSLFSQLWTLDRRNATARTVKESLAHMLDIGPRDGLEGMLAAQMVSVHKTAMRLIAESYASGQTLELGNYRLNHALRLMRLFALQVEALNRHRGKPPSEQKVTVEHVHVHEGGQAIVGNVTPPPKNPPQDVRGNSGVLQDVVGADAVGGGRGSSE